MEAAFFSDIFPMEMECPPPYAGFPGYSMCTVLLYVCKPREKRDTKINKYSRTSTYYMFQLPLYRDRAGIGHPFVPMLAEPEGRGAGHQASTGDRNEA